jgi:hypothetical protein
VLAIREVIRWYEARSAGAGDRAARQSRRWTSDLDAADEASIELVYTILTRARNVAVIVVDSATRPDVVAALRRLRPDRLLFWDDAARSQWHAVVGRPHARRRAQVVADT